MSRHARLSTRVRLLNAQGAIPDAYAASSYSGMVSYEAQTLQRLIRLSICRVLVEGISAQVMVIP